MATNDKATAPRPGEFASATKLEALNSGYLAQLLLENPDAILQSRGDQELTIYKELLRDDQVASCYQQRRLALTSKEWIVEAASDSPEDVNAADFVRQQLKRLNFDALTAKMHFAIHYGYAVAEVIWGREDNRITIKDIKTRPRWRFRFNRKGEPFLLTSSNPTGEKLPPRKFWILDSGAEDDHNPYGTGLAHALYWPVFFKRNNIKFWLMFLEKFGMPTAAAKLPPGQAADAGERMKALQVLDSIQADSGVVVPDNMVIDLIEAARSGTADYDGLCERMDKAISKIILSQTMTTDDGSSQAQAKVHDGVKESVIKADADLICESFNGQVIKWLTAFNFPSATPPRVYRDFSEDEDLNTRAERDNKILNLGFEPDENYIKETYGPGWKKKAPVPTTPPTPGEPIPADFTEISQLLAKRIERRADQQELIEAAEILANDYQEALRPQIEKLLAHLAESQDFETFKDHLSRTLEHSTPSPESVEALAKATFASRLKGLLFQQRDKGNEDS